MPDYTPVYTKGEVVTGTASAAVVGGQLLEVSGNGSVAPPAANAVPSVKVVGVAASDTPINGRVSFYGRGPVHESIADGTVTAGDLVVTATNAGRAVRTLAADAVDLGATYVEGAANTALNAALAAHRGILGVALTTAADNTKVRWMLFA